MKISSEKLSYLRKQAADSALLFLSALIIGALCGVIGALFAKSIEFVTELRAENNWLVYLLPLGGLVSVGLYRLTKNEGIGTVRVLETARGEARVSVLLMPAVFISSVITHLFGGSAGKEGAALQIGGAVAEVVSKLTRADGEKRSVYTVCGMAALFSAVFGTPVGACVFAMEVVLSGKLIVSSAFPALLSSVAAHLVSVSIGVSPERFHIPSVPQFGFGVLVKTLGLAVIIAAVSVLFCFLLHKGEHLFAKMLKNPFVRIMAGGCAIIILTLIFGTDYNGGGLGIIERIFEEGTVKPEAFFLKIIFTVITVSAGYKGGEIVPSFFIGSTLGATVAPLFGFSPEYAAAIGISAFFCGVTNCPIASAIISVELFGSEGFVLFASASFIARAVSGKICLYSK